jgi:hypothetical protein
MSNSPCRIDNSRQEHSNRTLAETHRTGNAALSDEKHQNSIRDLLDVQELYVNSHAVMNWGTDQT